ncbi:MAG: hypothetical protein DI533_01450 [Cereibacter sphaeroides]|uniref:YhdP central domain-containing protein n=1 Tax=Cereibacter sphaeroides TaxID=1063 RepID=A0A2W5SBX1_CERSP|nr:MAG: hypothetical protein DI533_01450 [Cereibacter sphaeroides]
MPQGQRRAEISTQASPQPDLQPRPPRHRRLRWLLRIAVLVVVIVIGGFALLGLTGKPLRLPVWVIAEAEARINRMIDSAIQDGASVALGGAVLLVGRDWVPHLELQDVRLINPEGKSVVVLPEVQVVIDPEGLMQGQVKPSLLRVIGAQVALRRREDGLFDLVLGADVAGPAPGNLAEVLNRIESTFDLPALQSLTRIEAQALTLTLDDRRAGRVWEVGDGQVTIGNSPNEVSMSLGFGVTAGGTSLARADVVFVGQKHSSAARISATVTEVAAQDIAAQAPVLAWLGVLDAPISGRISAALDVTGRFETMEGTLNIGAGALQPTAETKPVPFARAGLAFSVDPKIETITLKDASIESKSLRVKLSGRTNVAGLNSGIPTSFTSQIQIRDLLVDPEGLFQEPVRFSEGDLDMRLTLQPFKVEIGQISLREDKTRLLGKGVADAKPSGWDLALDVKLNEIRHDRLLALWPMQLAPKTRTWLVNNVQRGLLFNVEGGLRLRPKQDPLLSLSYEFAGGDVRFISTMPPIKRGYGYSTIIGQTYTIFLDRGHVTPPQGGEVDVAGSVFQVADITQKPARAEITLLTQSGITAALSLLDEPPFRFLTKAGFPVSLAEGRAVMVAKLALPLQARVTLDDVVFSVTGVLSQVMSDSLVKGRILRADKLALKADNTGLQIGGPGTLGQAAFDATWRQDFGPTERGKSRVDGTVDLSQSTLDEFSVTLPKGAVTGQGTGQLHMNLVKGGGTFQVNSDLTGIALRFSPIGLSKQPNARAAFEIAGKMGSPASIDRLALQSGDVSIEGSVTLRPEGGLQLARFPSVKSGKWLDISVDMTGNGPGKDLGIAITGGRLDLRGIPGGSSGGGDSPPLQVALDRVQVTEGISLTGLRGRFTTTGGVQGDFTAAVNGAAAINGALAPDQKGTAIRITSGDAGAVIAASGIFSKARGGSLDMTLHPLGPSGVYDGRATLSNISVRGAPILAELLNAISVVGLLDQLNQSGLAFNSAEAQFRTSPQGVAVSRSSAVGASLGVSMSGTYTSAGSVLNMEGVISPIYMLNSIGSILTRPGEGLFGFNYSLSGTASDPRVSVNPLSILTPGMFREIFRAQPPSRAPAKPRESTR